LSEWDRFAPTKAHSHFALIFVRIFRNVFCCSKIRYKPKHGDSVLPQVWIWFKFCFSLCGAEFGFCRARIGRRIAVWRRTLLHVGVRNMCSGLVGDSLVAMSGVVSKYEAGKHIKSGANGRDAQNGIMAVCMATMTPCSQTPVEFYPPSRVSGRKSDRKIYQNRPIL